MPKKAATLEHALFKALGPLRRKGVTPTSRPLRQGKSFLGLDFRRAVLRGIFRLRAATNNVWNNLERFKVSIGLFA